MKKIVPWVIAVCVIIALAGGWLLFGGRALQWYYTSQATRAIEENRPERAAEMLQKRLDMTPGDDTLRLRLAEMLAGMGAFSRAEYILHEGLEEAADPVPFYAALSAVFVTQDKLYDAVALLDGVKNPLTAEKLSALRPADPVPQPLGGVYQHLLEVSVTVPEGYSCYISWEGEIPSIERDRYTEPLTLQPGITQVKAVMVDEAGIVSGWAVAEYRLENVRVPLTFADPMVERDVRAALNKPEGELYSDEAAALTELHSVEPAAYKTLSDLEPLTGLTKLTLQGLGEHCDISVLPKMGKLAELRLQSMSLDSMDLEVISQMLWLRVLSLPENQMTILTPLSALTELTELNLSSNSLMELEDLRALTALTGLNLAGNAVQDVSVLRELTALKSLDLSGNRIVTLDGLQNMKALTTLSVAHNYLSGLFEIQGLTALQELDISSNALTSLSALSALTALRVLKAPGNELEALEALSTLAALETLDVSGNQIAALTGLESLTSLSELEASKNKITGVEPLRGLPALAVLRLENNAVQTLQPLKDCPKLKTVYAFGNTLTDPVDAFSGTGITLYRN